MRPFNSLEIRTTVKTHLTKDIELAIVDIKKEYHHECVFLGHWHKPLIGSHIFKRRPYISLAALRLNIVPASEYFDRKIEAIADPWERIKFIRLNVHESWFDKVWAQMNALEKHIFEQRKTQGRNEKWL